MKQPGLRRTEKLLVSKKNTGRQKLYFIYHQIHVKGKRGVQNTS